MKKQLAFITALFLITTMLTSTAFAWRSVRTGQKNFERAWSALHFKRMDNVDKYFTKAAEAYGQALAEKPPSRTTMFASNLTMAGMSLYYADRYQECVDAMDMAVKKDDRIWEGFLYKGLSLAAMDEKEEAVKAFIAYMKSSPGQPILSSAVEKQITDLETDSGTLTTAIPIIEKAAVDQFQNNVTLQNTPRESEQCSAMYWWRYNKAPCTEVQPFTK